MSKKSQWSLLLLKVVFLGSFVTGLSGDFTIRLSTVYIGFATIWIISFAVMVEKIAEVELLCVLLGHSVTALLLHQPTEYCRPRVPFSSWRKVAVNEQVHRFSAQF